MGQNRRRWTRVRPQGMAAHLRTSHGRTPCLVENISVGGLFVRTDQLEEVGKEVSVDLVKPGWKKQLSLRARVTSRIDSPGGRLPNRMPGLGMQFVQVDAGQHQRLRAMMRELGANEDDADVTLPDDATEAELRALGDAGAEPPAPRWKQVQLVEEQIASAVENVPAPEPLTLTPALPEEPADLTAKASLPTIRGHHEPRTGDSVPPAIGGSGPTELARLQTQLRGLVMQLSDAQHQLALRDAEIERLREELDAARAQLDGALRRT